MGTFDDNLTLNGVVCDDCNQHFGETIDLMLGRGSAEAVLRFDYGVQPADRVRRIRRDRVRFSLRTSDAWNGLLLELAPEAETMAVNLVPQVGFRRSREEAFTFISEEALACENTALPPGPYPEGNLLVVASSDAVEARLIAALQRRGVIFRREQQTRIPVQPNEMLPVEVRARCDSLVLRCLAKIAFNYLAYCEGRNLVVEKSFCAIRRFIRWGEQESYSLVEVDDLPILADDLPHLRQTNGHLVTVNWAADCRSIVGQVSLFNHARYRISLARSFPGPWRPICHGHHFNIEARMVEPLAAASLAT